MKVGGILYLSAAYDDQIIMYFPLLYTAPRVLCIYYIIVRMDNNGSAISTVETSTRFLRFLKSGALSE